MKVFGFLPVYEDADWLDYTIRNLLEFVDYLIISEGYHGPPWHFNGNRSKDGTIEIINRYGNHPKIYVFKSSWSISMNLGKALCLKKALRIAKKKGINAGDWYFLCDVDEFYTKEQKKELKKILKATQKDYLRVHNRMFIYNFVYYIDGIHGRFYRYKEGMKFGFYGQHPCYKDGIEYVNCKEKIGSVLEDDPMFHYSFVRKTSREWKRRIMEVKGRRRTKGIYAWINKSYLKWDEKNAEKIYEQNKVLFGKYGWFSNDGRIIKKYTGLHPEILMNHPYRHIQDIRKL